MIDQLILERLVKAEQSAGFLVDELRDIYGKTNPVFSLLIENDLEVAVKIRRRLLAIINAHKATSEEE